MDSMRIIAAGRGEKQNTPLHFLPASSPRLRLLNEVLRFGSWPEEFEVPLPKTKPRPEQRQFAAPCFSAHAPESTYGRLALRLRVRATLAIEVSACAHSAMPWVLKDLE